MAETDRQGYALTLTDAPDAQAAMVIEDGLTAFNLEKAGYVDSTPLAVLIHDPNTAEVIGGLLGKTTLGVFFVDLVFLPAMLRGQGAGSDMMRAAEAEARRRGCTRVVLFTIWFQAPGFYARHGYQEVGRIECELPGHTRICMTKALVEEAASTSK